MVSNLTDHSLTAKRGGTPQATRVTLVGGSGRIRQWTEASPTPPTSSIVALQAEATRAGSQFKSKKGKEDGEGKGGGRGKDGEGGEREGGRGKDGERGKGGERGKTAGRVLLWISFPDSQDLLPPAVYSKNLCPTLAFSLSRASFETFHKRSLLLGI